MSVLPSAIEKLIEELGTLPGVGPRTAERFAYYLFQTDPNKSQHLAEALLDLHKKVGLCQKTFFWVEAGEDVSKLYSEPNRDKKIVAVVEDPLDVVSLENTGQYRGTYHVLGGLISPIDSTGPDQLRIKELHQRIKDDKVKELILAMNASVEGESTSLYIQKQLKNNPVTITRLAHGLPVGIDLEYADTVTLSRALEGRQKIE